ncbi:MAG: Trk system potassium transporter TrkA [Planctomycetes bacterium]|nr:Trk system potassium transporter TrkA [Planctomycetota bacterium]MCP4772341.1 Trk system potassium transporter TrkA [Planctomycetota bacterium]MCP4861559.1 Trk system potassium transporter TrkA [Planctomycetota bacterium]
MRITIGGEDAVAFRLAEALMADHEVTLIVPEGTRDTALEKLDVQTIHGPTSSGKTLKAAEVSQADLFVACTPADERNLVACAEAKRLGALSVTCFLRRHEVQTNESEAQSLATSLHIDQVILPAARLAREILRIVMVPGALEAEAFINGKVRLVKRSIEKDAHFTEGTLKEIGVPKDVVLVMVQRGKETFIPSGDTAFQEGDLITAMGTMQGINRLLTRYLTNRKHGRDPRRALVVGGGAVGFAVAEGLEKANWDVKLIEANEKRALEIAPQLKSLVLYGDGTNLELLREEHIADYPVLIAVTSNDEKNLLVSLLAKQQGVQRIITRADKESNEMLFESVGIDVVRSATGAAIRTVVKRTNRSENDLMAEFEHGLVKVLRIEVPADQQPQELHLVKASMFAIIGAILRDEKVIIPQGRDSIQGGDQLLVFCKADDAESTRHFFENLPPLEANT